MQDILEASGGRLKLAVGKGSDPSTVPHSGSTAEADKGFLGFSMKLTLRRV